MLLVIVVRQIVIGRLVVRIILLEAVFVFLLLLPVALQKLLVMTVFDIIVRMLGQLLLRGFIARRGRLVLDQSFGEQIRVDNLRRF